MKPIGLLISCATPAASCPMEAIFSVWRTWRWRCRISVMSWKVATAPRSSFFTPEMGAQETPTGTTDPSGRVITLSAPLKRILSASVRETMPWPEPSGNQSRTRWPISASIGCPRICAAGVLHEVTRPSGSNTSTALFMFWMTFSL